MIPSNPSAGKEMRSRGHSEKRDSVQSPPDVGKSNRTQHHRNDWAGVNGQVDYFVSAGLNKDSMYNTALTPGGSYLAISPIRRSGRPANSTNPAGGQRTYPSQELNSRYADLQQLSPEKYEVNAKLPPLPPPLPPPKTEYFTSVVHAEDVTSMPTGASQGLGQFQVEEVASVPARPSDGISKTFYADEVTSMGTGLTQDLNNLATNKDYSDQSYGSSHSHSVLDSFELESVGEDSYVKGQLKSEGLDEYCSGEIPAPPRRVSTSPSPKKARQLGSRTSKSRKKTKGNSKMGTTGIGSPTKLDILRGRGGLTNRHAGNMRFRDEARKLRTHYRDACTSREEKYLLSEELARRVQGYGGRFLQKGEDKLWYEMSKSDARKKASQVLREEKWE